MDGSVGKIFFVKKYLITSSVFKLQKWFLHQNGVEFNKKSKSELTILWPLVGIGNARCNVAIGHIQTEFVREKYFCEKNIRKLWVLKIFLPNFT